MRNLCDFVTHWATTNPEHEAIVFGERRLNYQDLHTLVVGLADNLKALRLQKGDRVAVKALTSPEYLALYMAIARQGAVLVGINPLYTPQETAHLLEVTRPALVVSAPPFAAGLDEAIARVPVPHKVLFQGQADGWMDWEAFRAGGTERAAESLDAPGGDDPVLIVFTSGTTGKPKGAVLTHAGIVANIGVQVRQFAMTEADRVVHHLPMNHVGGATEIFMGAIMAGATLLVMDRFTPNGTLELVARERATFLGQVPAMFIMELNLPDFAQYDLSSLTRLVVAGAATPTAVMKQMLKTAPVLTGYGMTEVCGFVTYTDPQDDPETVARTVGEIAPEFELRVVDGAGAPVPQGEVGEVLLRGACLMAGYFHDPQATREAVDEEGWFATGDMGRLDKRGYLTLVGRKKEMYITGGYNVYPVEIEEALSQQEGVLLCAVVGGPDDVLGEVGTAYVVPKPGKKLAAEGLRAFLAERLAEYKIPRHFEIREQLPMTPLGKVDKKQLA